MLRLDLLQNRHNKCKISVLGTGLEPASLRFPVFCVYQFRHSSKSKIHNGSIKVDCLSSTLINLIFSIPMDFYRIKLIA